MFMQRIVLILLTLFCTTGWTASIGSKAPECPVDLIDGNRTFNLSEYTGKVVYMDFWASWCPPCQESFPHLNKLHHELHMQGFEVVGINVDENRNDAVQFLNEYPVEFTVGMDPNGMCPKLFDVMAMPTSYIIDRKGLIRHIHLGFKQNDIQEIRTIVQSLLAEN